ncbi:MULTISPECIES: peptidylprolyl isomerase [Clostridium]|uniref:Foldase protein PrsA n=4 Tax=Clostridium TaxID=1485 RepID=D8GJ93_CLOLD|nr:MULTISPECIES: peptidylprolyl isomerase [Clostridium]ADK17181.1 foldase protein precursor [Clostridium ljungdahlii DSM 13528]AGY76219.1 peptidylprolyl isomerase [Clostridium autoethanogenum DSM 10061]ALU36381.1 Foldase protein prsA [Clostridium autoethanogenum DSM 10061]OAA84643.1 Foldase protein PrsA 1 precursor [Clostridium ljungdahlii DSM 13528]OAA90684.1 Foldase protein PrsA 1 precursor [Clostridium coskatii]
MKNIKRLVAAAFITVFAFSTAGCNMIEKTPEAIANSTVATVNGEKITRGDLDKDPNTIQLLSQAKQQYGSDYAKNDEATSAIKTQKEQILDNMITTKVIEQKAKELKLLPDESKLKSDMDKKIDDIKKQNFKGDTSQFDAALKAQGFTEESFKTMFLAQLKTQAIETNISNYLAKSVKVTDKQIKDYYNANKDKYTEQPDKMHLAHILVKTKDEAQKVKARLDKGEDFAKVAKEVSQDTATKDKGGDLGFVNYNDSGYDAQFMAGAKALKEGAISDPVQSSFGYHIIKCIKKQEYPVKDFNKVKDDIKKQLESDQKSKLVSQKVQEWKKAASITKKEKNIM